MSHDFHPNSYHREIYLTIFMSHQRIVLHFVYRQYGGTNLHQCRFSWDQNRGELHRQVANCYFNEKTNPILDFFDDLKFSNSSVIFQFCSSTFSIIGMGA